jgi:hypothetical protein
VVWFHFATSIPIRFKFNGLQPTSAARTAGNTARQNVPYGRQNENAALHFQFAPLLRHPVAHFSNPRRAE